MQTKPYFFLIFLVALFALITSCEETTPVDETPLVAPPDSLRATSIDSSTVRLRWKLSSDESKTYFKDYVLYIEPGAFAPKYISKGTNTFDVTGLSDGVIYTFTLKARNSDDEVSSGSVSLQWSPAFRFIKNINDEPIRVYETASQFGSGLQLYDQTNKKPRTLKVASGQFWNLGLYTKLNEQTIYTANYIHENNLYNFPTAPTYTTEISEDVFLTNTLNNVFDSQALNAKKFSKDIAIDLKDPDFRNGVVIIVRTRPAGQTEWNYAKVLIKPASGGGLLHGNPDNRYIECEISYQRKPGVPFAKPIN
ncbi:MAG: fibronectin type III domain-containing protein [Ignavibacteria bacterium]|nr:fibronectin type III domain-containing protein [Ignavibacteria bacterium]